MAITQPTYPVTTSQLVTHIGAYVDARIALSKGVALYSGGSYPARPTGFASVEWIGPTDPGSSAVDGDTWVPTA